MNDLEPKLRQLFRLFAGRPCQCAADLEAVLNQIPPRGGIIVGGQVYPVWGVEVRTWHNHGLTFHKNNAVPRVTVPRWVVLHWTGSGARVGFKGAAQVHRTLTNRGLSVEFVITDDGIVWQFVDPLEKRCRHASRLNKISIGVEVTGPGWLKRAWLSTRGGLYKATIHGWTSRFFDYLPAQHLAMASLANALVEALPIEPNVMLAPWERRKTKEFLSDTGFCGHLHCASLEKRNPKCDPGTAPLIALDHHLNPPQ